MERLATVEAGERGPQRLRRRALELADEIAERLERFEGDDARTVHDIRRRLKELRAMARLVAEFLPHGGRAEIDRFRDAARQLAAQRDAKAAVEAFDRLAERFAEEWTPRQFGKIRRALSLRRRPADPITVAELRMAMAAERSRIAAWPVDDMQPHDLWRAAGRAYRAARRAMRTANREGTRESFHRWRRRAKVLWYQLQFLQLLGMATFDAEIQSLHKLSRALGDHHDLALIDDLCRREPESFGSARYVARFRRILDVRIHELQETATAIGGELFARRTREWLATAAAPRRRTRVGPKKSFRARAPVARSA